MDKKDTKEVKVDAASETVKVAMPSELDDLVDSIESSLKESEKVIAQSLQQTFSLVEQAKTTIMSAIHNQELGGSDMGSVPAHTGMDAVSNPAEQTAQSVDAIKDTENHVSSTLNSSAITLQNNQEGSHGPVQGLDSGGDAQGHSLNGSPETVVQQAAEAPANSSNMPPMTSPLTSGKISSVEDAVNNMAASMGIQNKKRVEALQKLINTPPNSDGSPVVNPPEST